MKSLNGIWAGIYIYNIYIYIYYIYIYIGMIEVATNETIKNQVWWINVIAKWWFPSHVFWFMNHNKYWLVVWNIFYFPIYWECHHPNWRTPSCFRGVGPTTNQYIYIHTYFLLGHRGIPIYHPVVMDGYKVENWNNDGDPPQNPLGMMWRQGETVMGQWWGLPLASKSGINNSWFIMVYIYSINIYIYI